MLGSNLKKEPTKAELEKKVQAWKTINEVLAKSSSNFMNSLGNMLVEKQVQHSQLKEKLEKNEGTEQDSAEYIFLGGYIQCLKDITQLSTVEKN